MTKPLQPPPQNAISRPTYAAAFRCIGAECEDNCCHGWDIPVDKKTYDRYKTFPEENLGQIVAEFVTITTPAAPDPLYAQIHRLPSGQCAFFGSDKLCRIQKNYGARLLSASCSIYPRNLNLVDGELEGTLSLSCPEAARQVLLDPGFLNKSGSLYSGTFRTDNHFHPGNREPDGERLLAVRRHLLEVIRDRRLPLRDRLLQIGEICEKLQESNAFAENKPPNCGSKEPYPDANPAARLDLVLKLTAERAADRTCSPRFIELYWNLVETVGADAAETPGADLERFLSAEQKYLQPYLGQNPYLLENYLINYILLHLFPFGRTGSPSFQQKNPMQEFVLLAIQLIWLKGLMVGLAGIYRSSLGSAHIVYAVQAFTRAIENYPGIIGATMLEAEARGLINLSTVATLL
jgi:lysine-N-methylase